MTPEYCEPPRSAYERVHMRRRYPRARQPRPRWNKNARAALSGMPQKSDPAHARAQALFKQRQQQQAEAPKAMAEYRAAEQAKYARMRQLRALRLAREAQARAGRA
jgi:hypothetical protein